MAELRATPYANPLTGLSNDAIQGLLAFMQDKRRTQQLQGLGNLLESTGIPKTVERAAYAESPRGLLDALTNVNRANVPFLKPETAEAAMTLAPIAAPVNRALMQATKGLPVGASIQDVGKQGLLGIAKRDASETFGAGAQRIKYTDPKSGGSIDVLSRPDGTASVLGLEVPETFRGQGVGGLLQSRVLQDFPDMQGQVSSKAAATTAYRLGRRPPNMPDATLDDVYKMIDENSSVNLVSPQMQQRIAPTPETGLLGIKTPSQFVPNVEAGKEMIVHHNISPEKLARVEKVGGMPVPSVAVSNVENPLTSFGNISLIGDKSMAIPSAKNPVYGFDAYTARTPEIDFKFDAKSVKNIDSFFSDVAKKIPDGDYTVDRLKQDWKYRFDSDIYKAKFLDEQGMLPDPKDFGKDTWKFTQEVNQRVRDSKPAYESWSANMDNTLAEAGVNPTERIFRGYTDSGNRRYAEATLDNLVREMKGGAGAEGFFYGVGNIRAVATPKFKNFEQVKAARENIVSSKEFEPVKKKINEAFEDLTDRMRSLEGNNNYAYKPEDALYELGQVKNVNFLDKIYKDVPEALKADVQIFMNKVKSMPTEYFEIKPQRAVQVSEFEGAIVPKDAPQKSIDYLKSQGIDKIYFYETPEERTQLFKQFGDKMFAAPALPLGATGLLDEEKRKEIQSLLE